MGERVLAIACYDLEQEMYPEDY
jgi:sodium/potassium-transporting ATPase subunit alpha